MKLLCMICLVYFSLNFTLKQEINEYNIKNREDFDEKFQEKLKANRDIDYFLTCSIMYDKRQNPNKNFLEKYNHILPNVITPVSKALDFFSNDILAKRVYDYIPDYTESVDKACSYYLRTNIRDLERSFSNLFDSYIHFIGILEAINEINEVYKSKIFGVNAYIYYYIKQINKVIENEQIK